MDQRAGGDALSSAGRSPAVAADGPSPSEDAATEEADGAPSPRPPLRERSPGTANKQSAETTGGAEEDDAAAKRSKRADAPPSRGPKKAKRHRKDGQSAKDEPDSALDAPQESACGAILASRKDGEDASRRVPDAGGRGRSDAAHARLRDSSVRAHGALVRYSSSSDTRQQRQGERERFEPNGPGPANREYDDEVGSCYQDRVSGQRRWPRFQPPELGTSGTSRPRQEREHFEPYGPGSAKREYNGEDGSRRYGRYQHQGSGQQRQCRFQPPEQGPSRPRQERERFEPYGPGSAKREYNDEDCSRHYHHQGPGQQQRQSRFQPPELDPSRPSQERFAPWYVPVSAKRGYDDEDGSWGRDSWERRKRSRRDNDGRKHGHEEHGQSFSSRDRPLSRSGDRSQFRLRSSSRDRSRSRGDRQSDWGRGRKEEKSPWGGTNDRDHSRRSWIDSTRRAIPEGIYRSTMLDRNEGRGRVWGRAQGRGEWGGRGGRGRGATSIQGRGPDFRTCQTVFELSDLARCHLDSMSNRDIAAFWSLLPRLARNRVAQDPNLEENLSIASSAVGMLDEFEARHLSNLIYSFGLVGYNPEIEAETLFDVFGEAAVRILHTFKPQALSNILWAFVKVDTKNSRLFQETGGVISGMDLDSFKPQDFANILWSFAKASEADSKLFQALGNHIVMRSLNDFWPQDVSNIVWALFCRWSVAS
ncbi:hypothetical protein THAOC_08020 [Thalassiosira oceanica]|uniref:RNA-editing substrate-binding complex 6 protein domain-containing protein n=2 Tax=Thalassiosira oceanica TaxID=159749 RepID=K0SW17_THAOC|nr:hypothetical protein THAOC_08020 [Thalassiosira oceanica]|eukprot:EJK70608.1 hypothetical protein THAOC_08020 [Thalassiosira oceanica]